MLVTASGPSPAHCTHGGSPLKAHLPCHGQVEGAGHSSGRIGASNGHRPDEALFGGSARSA